METVFLKQLMLSFSIFVTHLHGDHCFGLGSMLVMLGNVKCQSLSRPGAERLHVYGPPGLAILVKMLGVTGLFEKLSLPVEITELVMDPATAHPPQALDDNEQIFVSKLAPFSQRGLQVSKLL